MKKLCSGRGETLIETLCAMLIIMLVFLFLCNSIVAAARTNAAVRDKDTSFRYSDGQKTQDLTVTVKRANGAEAATFPASEYRTENGYIYYETK